jgi:hypothetical protein
MATDTIRETLAAPWDDAEERVVEAGAFPIHVRKRGIRYDLDDAGEAVARGRSLGAPREWLEIAERVVNAEGFNVNRTGVVFVQVVEGRDVAAIAARLGACAERVHAALLDGID